MPAADRLGSTIVVKGGEDLGGGNTGGGGGGKQMIRGMLIDGCVMEGDWLIRGDM
jgi:hypothetical protein